MGLTGIAVGVAALGVAAFAASGLPGSEPSISAGTAGEPRVTPAPRRAGLGLRLAARLADLLPLSVLIMLGPIAAAVAEALGASPWVWLAGLSAPIGAFLVYFVPGTAATGQTWGKRLAGIRVERPDGTPLSQGEALSRALVDGTFEVAARFLVGLTDLLWMLGRQRRALHDLAAHSIVVVVGSRRRLLVLAAGLGAVAASVLIYGLRRGEVVKVYFIPSEAMTPTLLPGDRVMANRLMYRLGPLRRGDVVVFHAPPQVIPPGEGAKDFVKRVVGLPGDTVTIRHGEGVYINGKHLEEAPGLSLPDYDWPTNDRGERSERAYTVPPGQCFVLGDNRNHSYDSHIWQDLQTGRPRPGLPLSLIVGKVTFRIYPDNRAGVVP